MTPQDSASAGPSSPPAGDEQLSDILDSWLVHDESCPTSWSGIGPDKCDCIAKDQKRNLEKALNAYILAEILDIVNTGQFIAPNLTAKENVRSYQDFIVEKAIARFGKGGTA